MQESTELTLWQPDTLASHTVLPGSEKAKKMTAQSGRTSLRGYKKFGPVGLLARMLLVMLGLDDVLSDLESYGYTSQPFVIPACSVGAFHRRDRVFIVSHSYGQRMERSIPQQILGSHM